MWFLLFKISMFVLVIRPTANYINYQGALIPQIVWVLKRFLIIFPYQPQIPLLVA